MCKHPERMHTSLLSRSELLGHRLTNYGPEARESVIELLSGLPALYPHADEWLARRLDDVEQRRARCTLAIVAGQSAAVAIETPKPGNRVKLSTLYVAPQFRRTGIGGMLVRSCWHRWLVRGVDSVHVTVRTGREEALYSVLEPLGFSFLTLLTNRYGRGEHEFVLQAKVGRSNELLRGSS